MKRITAGVTRTVFLVGRFAVKVPCGRYSVEFFLKGMLANMREREMWRHTYSAELHLCPVLWSAPLGLLLVMPRCRTLSDAEFVQLNVLHYAGWVEMKADSFGYMANGQLVAVDYGN